MHRLLGFCLIAYWIGVYSWINWTLWPDWPRMLVVTILPLMLAAFGAAAVRRS